MPIITNTIKLVQLQRLIEKLKGSEYASTGSICPYCETVFNPRFDGCLCGKGAET